MLRLVQTKAEQLSRTVPAPCGFRAAALRPRHSRSTSLAPPATRAPRLRPSRPGWMEWHVGQESLTEGPSRLSSACYDQRAEHEDLRNRSSLRSPLRLDGRRAARSRVEDTQEARGARQDDAGYGLRSCFGALDQASSVRSSTPSHGGRQEVGMYKTTKRKTAQSGRRTVRPTAPWSFGLHRTIAAAAGAICVFSLQMRLRHQNANCNDITSRRDLFAVNEDGVGTARDAERREESP